MDVIANIQKYKRSFNRLSKNKENMFKDYLKSHGFSKMELLHELGLNEQLVNEHNFKEIEDLVSIIIQDETFPIISFPPQGESLNLDNLSIYNPNNKQDLVIGENFIRFNICSRTEKDESLTENINHISYIYENGMVKKIDITVNFSQDYDSIVKGIGFANSMVIKAIQTEYKPNGEIIRDNSYDVNIKTKIGQMLFQSIYRELLHDSILPGIAKILELLKDGKLKREDIEINLNISNLLKK